MFVPGLFMGVLSTVFGWFLFCLMYSQIKRIKARRLRQARILALTEKHSHGMLGKVASELDPKESVRGRDSVKLVLETMGFEVTGVSVNTYASLGRGSLDIEVKGSDMILKML